MPYVEAKKPDEEDRRRMLDELIREHGDLRMIELTGRSSQEHLNDWMIAVAVDPEVEGWVDITDAVCWRLRESPYPFLADAMITIAVKVVDDNNVMVGFSTHGWFNGEKLNYDQTQMVNDAVTHAAAAYGITVPEAGAAESAWSGTAMGAVGSISSPDMTHPENIADMAKFMSELETTWPADAADEPLPSYVEDPPEDVEAFILCVTPEEAADHELKRVMLSEALGIDLPALEDTNVRTMCSSCGRGLVAAPNIPPHVKPLCLECYLDLPDIENIGGKVLTAQRQALLDAGLPPKLLDAMQKSADEEMQRRARERREERERSKRRHPSGGNDDDSVSPD